MSKTERIIMGIDPGTNVMGWAVIRAEGNKAEMLAMGVIELKKMETQYLRLGKIFERVTSVIDMYHPDEIAIEAPFFGKNVQSMLKLGRAQGVAIAAAIQREVPITEYEPTKIKVSITGVGSASKEQVANMLQKMLNLSDEAMKVKLDATDALGAAYCHFLKTTSVLGRTTRSTAKSWEAFVKANSNRIG